MQERSDTLRIDGLEDRLSALVERDPRFGQEVDVTSGRLSVGELLRNIARASGVNLSVRSVDQTPVTCNFTRTRVDDLLRFLCLEYRLDIEVTRIPTPAPTPTSFSRPATRRCHSICTASG